jgi:hypothetical protein
MPPRKAQPAQPGPQTELDRLDPAPVQPPPPRPRQARQRKGPVELAVRRDLARYPDDMRKGGIAAAALRLASELDAHLVVGRDAAGHAREIRMCLTQLHDFAPGEVRGDSTDEVRERRERRLAGG